MTAKKKQTLFEEFCEGFRKCYPGKVMSDLDILYVVQDDRGMASEVMDSTTDKVEWNEAADVWFNAQLVQFSERWKI